MDTRNIRAEIARNGFINSYIGQFAGLKKSCIDARVAGKVDFRVEELIAIRDNCFPDCTLDYLAGCVSQRRI